MVIQTAQTSLSDIRPARASRRLHPLLRVVGWELRRILTAKATIALALAAFGFCLFLIRVSSQDTYTGASVSGVHNISLTIPWTTLVGLVSLLPPMALIFSLMLPFVTADGVTRDLKRRTHELVMTTALPSWAYVWGRYLAGVVVSLGLASILFLALVVMALALHAVEAGAYPPLDIGGASVVWAVIVLPAVVFLSSVSFALGTLLPRRANLIKLAVLLGWFACGMLLPDYLMSVARHQGDCCTAHHPGWYAAYLLWEPTGVAGAQYYGLGRFYQGFFPLLGDRSLSDQVILDRVAALEQQMPNLWPWAEARLAWAALGVAAVLAATLAFRRFRAAL